MTEQAVIPWRWRMIEHMTIGKITPRPTKLHPTVKDSDDETCANREPEIILT